MENDFELRVRDALVGALGMTRAAAADFARRELSPAARRAFGELFTGFDSAVCEVMRMARGEAAAAPAVDETPATE